MVAFNHALQDFMTHYSRGCKNWIFAPGLSAKELAHEIQTKLAAMSPLSLKTWIDGDGSSWDAWQHAIWLNVDLTLMRHVTEPLVQA